MKRALIIGISGQDGAYLAKLLLEKGYVVHGTSRDHEVSPFGNLRKLGIKDLVVLDSMVASDFRSVLTVLQKSAPDEVYNLAGRVRLRGRVGSLLEVGTGFHPELTGRDNVHLYGNILGMSKRE